MPLFVALLTQSGVKWNQASGTIVFKARFMLKKTGAKRREVSV